MREVEGSSIAVQGRDSGQNKRDSEESLPRGACRQIPEGLLQEISLFGHDYGVGPVINA